MSITPEEGRQFIEELAKRILQGCYRLANIPEGYPGANHILAYPEIYGDHNHGKVGVCPHTAIILEIVTTIFGISSDLLLTERFCGLSTRSPCPCGSARDGLKGEEYVPNLACDRVFSALKELEQVLKRAEEKHPTYIRMQKGTLAISQQALKMAKDNPEQLIEFAAGLKWIRKRISVKLYLQQQLPGKRILQLVTKYRKELEQFAPRRGRLFFADRNKSSTCCPLAPE